MLARALVAVRADVRAAPAWFGPFVGCLVLWAVVGVWLVRAQTLAIPASVRVTMWAGR